MKSFMNILCLLFIYFTSIHAHPYSNGSQAAASKQIKEWQHQYNRYIFETLKHRTSGCTFDKLQFRREWYVMKRPQRVQSLIAIPSRSSLSKQHRIDYTTAVRCLQKKPHAFPSAQVPGARSRFDDVIATHIFQAPYIHFSV